MAKKTILIVEDDIGTLHLLQQIVQRAGYQPLLARDGADALALLQQGAVDLVLLDIMLRDMDGWAVLKSIRGDLRLNRVPVFIVTGRMPSEHRSEMQVLEKLYDDYFLKPFDVRHLVERIGDMLKSRVAA